MHVPLGLKSTKFANLGSKNMTVWHFNFFTFVLKFGLFIIRYLLRGQIHMNVRREWTYPTESEKLLTHCLLAVSQILIVLSSLHDTINLPSGENLRSRRFYMWAILDNHHHTCPCHTEVRLNRVDSRGHCTPPYLGYRARLHFVTSIFATIHHHDKHWGDPWKTKGHIDQPCSFLLCLFRLNNWFSFVVFLEAFD